MSLVPADVPVHRASVGAMTVTQGSQVARTVNPYVYRGKGYDIREGPPEPPREKPVPKKPKRRKVKPRPKSRPKPPGYRKGDEGRASIAKRVERERLNRETLLAEREARRARFQASVRPSPGWRAMTGADLLDVLEDPRGQTPRRARQAGLTGQADRTQLVARAQHRPAAHRDPDLGSAARS